MKMTPHEWQLVQDQWQDDPRHGYAWIVREMGLPVSAPAVRKRALKAGWTKVLTTETPPKPRQSDQKTGGKLVDYRPELPGQIHRMALLGFTQAETAKVIGISERTFRDWLKDRPEVADAWYKGGVYADAQVARALFHRATGAVTPDSHMAVINDKVTITPTEKHYPPDTRAAFLWLNNRQPERWKNKVEVVEAPTIALVDKEKMDELYSKALEQAAETQKRMMGRAERLGLVMDGDISGTE